MADYNTTEDIKDEAESTPSTTNEKGYKYSEAERMAATDIALIGKKQMDTSRLFKQSRVTDILDTEDVYNFKLRPALQERLNVPFDGVVLSGFIDTWVAENNRPILMDFEDPNGANLKSAKKIKAAWERDSKRMRLKAKKLAMKHLAAISGRAIAKYFAESDPKYCPNLQIIDHLDFHCEPNGGGHLDDHYFMWQENIFRSKEDLEAGGEGGWYDAIQVKAVIASYESPDFKRTTDAFNNKQSRYMSIGLDMESNNYIGGTLYNLIEGVTYYKGKKYHVIMDGCTYTWLRCVPLKEDFGNDMTPFISFAAPKADAFNFWNRGPGDSIKPVAEAIRLNLNEILNNNRKRNWDMKAVDMNMFPDIRKLDWRQDGVIHANVPMNASIQQGIYRFETPELSGALNLNAYLNNFVGEKLGINAGSQGQSAEDKVGIYQGNSFQISKRMRLPAEAEEEFHEDLGKRYDWGLWDHASEEEMVRMLSADGVGWEKITREDKDPEYIVVVKTDEGEKAQDSDMVRAQIEALASIEKDPNQLALVKNKKALIEEKLKLAGMKEDRIGKFFSEDSTDDIISEAKKAIELIVEGKDPGINWSATTAYLQYISDWILANSEDIDEKKKVRLDEYFEQHVNIAMKNAEQKQFRDEEMMKSKIAQAMVEDPKTAQEVTIGAPSTPALPTAPLTPTA